MNPRLKTIAYQAPLITLKGAEDAQLENAQTFLTQEQSQLTKTESATLEADMSVAITNLVHAETTQQALVQAGAKVAQKNLFDYLP